jgi:hypothetical protein
MKKKISIFLDQKFEIYFYPGLLHKGCPRNRGSLKPSEKNIQHFKT